MNLNGLRVVISQKMEQFITTGVRTSTFRHSLDMSYIIRAITRAEGARISNIQHPPTAVDALLIRLWRYLYRL
jgi:hypothetical protein